MYYGKKTDPFYKKGAWKQARIAALERDHYICQDCLTAKKRGARIRIRQRKDLIVHHILPREDYPELELELSNLISLCEKHHNKRHPEKGGNPESTPVQLPVGVRVIKV